MTTTTAESSEVMKINREKVTACMTCPLCHNLFRDATTVSECLHTFCRECIYNKITEDDLRCCPVCNVDLGCYPLDKLRADHNLQDIRSKIFPYTKQNSSAPRAVCSVPPLPPRRKEKSVSSLVIGKPKLPAKSILTGRRSKPCGPHPSKNPVLQESSFPAKKPLKDLEAHQASLSSPQTFSETAPYKKEIHFIAETSKQQIPDEEDSVIEIVPLGDGLWKPSNFLLEAARRAKLKKCNSQGTTAKPAVPDACDNEKCAKARVTNDVHDNEKHLEGKVTADAHDYGAICRGRFTTNAHDNEKSCRDRFTGDADDNEKRPRGRFTADVHDNEKRPRRRVTVDADDYEKSPRRKFIADADDYKKLTRGRFTADVHENEKHPKRRFRGDAYDREKRPRGRVTADANEYEKGPKARVTADANDYEKNLRGRFTADVHYNEKRPRGRFTADVHDYEKCPRGKFTADVHDIEKHPRGRVTADADDNEKSPRDRVTAYMDDNETHPKARVTGDAHDNSKRPEGRVTAVVHGRPLKGRVTAVARGRPPKVRVTAVARGRPSKVRVTAVACGHPKVKVKEEGNASNVRAEGINAVPAPSVSLRARRYQGRQKSKAVSEEVSVPAQPIVDKNTKVDEGSHPIWFSLIASADQKGNAALPQIRSSYLRIKDGNFPVEFIQKYLATKLNLGSETEVEISMMGQPLFSQLQLHHVVKWYVQTASSPDKIQTTVGSTAKDFVLVLTYARRAPPPRIPGAYFKRAYKQQLHL